MAIYSSSINSVSAAFVVHGKWTCTQMYSSPNYASCNLTISGTSTDYNCNYDTKTKKWTCVKAKSGSGTPNPTAPGPGPRPSAHRKPPGARRATVLEWGATG